MRRTRFTESQIVGILREYDSGKAINDIVREHGISKATFFNWRSKYAGLEVNDLKRLKELEEENSRLKKMYADLSLDNQILKELIKKSESRPRNKSNISKK